MKFTNALLTQRELHCGVVVVEYILCYQHMVELT